MPQTFYSILISVLLALSSFMFWIYLVKVLLNNKIKEEELGCKSVVYKKKPKNSYNLFMLLVLTNFKLFLIYQSYLFLISEKIADFDIVTFALSFASVYFLLLLFYAFKNKNEGKGKTSFSS